MDWKKEGEKPSPLSPPIQTPHLPFTSDYLDKGPTETSSPGWRVEGNNSVRTERLHIMYNNPGSLRVKTYTILLSINLVLLVGSLFRFVGDMTLVDLWN